MPQHDEGFCSKYHLEGCCVRAFYCIDHQICIDAENCNRKRLACKLFVRRVMYDLAEHIGMTPQGDYSFEIVHPDNPDLAGASSVVGISESHLWAFASIGGHGWSESDAFRVVIDKRVMIPSLMVGIDSCKDYNIEDVANFLTGIFRPRRITVWVEEKKAVSIQQKRGIELVIGMLKLIMSLIRKNR